MDANLAFRILSSLHEKGYEILPGLNKQEFMSIEDYGNFTFPPDLKALLSQGVPSDTNDKFRNWHNKPEAIIDDARDFILARFAFDIAESDYWHELFGNRPNNLKAAQEKALYIVSGWPPLIPIYAHRFIPSSPSQSCNPVLSVWQAVDTVIYGTNLIDYFNNEFKLNLQTSTPSEAKVVPYWSDAFDLVD